MSAIKCVIGLANPGERYALTRHNAGEWFLNLFISSNSWKTESSLHSRIAKKEIVFAIPTTYMNLSGQAAQAVCHYYKIKPEEILVAHDEIDLPVGMIRLKQDGGHGGHNGLRDIIKHLGTQNFWRLRIGVGRPTHASQVEHYVLNPPAKEERSQIDLSLQHAEAILPLLLDGQFQQAMQLLHTTNEQSSTEKKVN
jgi:PTH1 family peptidyl-tRNA hydrolase